MRRFMRKVEGLAVAALALIGAGQVVVWMNQAMQYALVAYGQWEAARGRQGCPADSVLAGIWSGPLSVWDV